MDRQEYEVEVRRTITTTVKVRASTPLSAARIVDNLSYPMPPATEWETIKGWEYIVYKDGVRLYEGDAQEMA